MHLNPLPENATETEAREWLREITRAIEGFHPDSPAEAYVNLFDGVPMIDNPDEINLSIDAAFGLLGDEVYDECARAMGAA